MKCLPCNRTIICHAHTYHTLIPSPLFTLSYLDIRRPTLPTLHYSVLSKRRGSIHSQSSKPHVHTCASSPACILHHCACTTVAACTIPPTTTPAPQECSYPRPHSLHACVRVYRRYGTGDPGVGRGGIRPWHAHERLYILLHVHH